MAIRVRIETLELHQLQEAVENYLRRIDDNVARTLLQAGYLIEGQAKETILQGPARSGAIYERGGMTAQRSAPGEPAKSDTGILQSSLRVLQMKGGGVEVGYEASIAPYGQFLEDPSKLNRPVLVPTLQELWPTITRLIGKAIRNTK